MLVGSAADTSSSSSSIRAAGESRDGRPVYGVGAGPENPSAVLDRLDSADSLRIGDELGGADALLVAASDRLADDEAGLGSEAGDTGGGGLDSGSGQNHSGGGGGSRPAPAGASGEARLANGAGSRRSPGGERRAPRHPAEVLEEISTRPHAWERRLWSARAAADGAGETEGSPRDDDRITDVLLRHAKGLRVLFGEYCAVDAGVGARRTFDDAAKSARGMGRRPWLRLCADAGLLGRGRLGREQALALHAWHARAGREASLAYGQFCECMAQASMAAFAGAGQVPSTAAARQRGVTPGVPGVSGVDAVEAILRALTLHRPAGLRRRLREWGIPSTGSPSRRQQAGAARDGAGSPAAARRGRPAGAEVVEAPGHDAPGAGRRMPDSARRRLFLPDGPAPRRQQHPHRQAIARGPLAGGDGRVGTHQPMGRGGPRLHAPPRAAAPRKEVHPSRAAQPPRGAKAMAAAARRRGAGAQRQQGAARGAARKLDASGRRRGGPAVGVSPVRAEGGPGPAGGKDSRRGAEAGWSDGRAVRDGHGREGAAMSASVSSGAASQPGFRAHRAPSKRRKAALLGEPTAGYAAAFEAQQRSRP